MEDSTQVDKQESVKADDSIVKVDKLNSTEVNQVDATGEKHYYANAIDANRLIDLMSDWAAFTGGKIMDLTILTTVMLLEVGKLGKWLLNSTIVRVWVDIILQTAFVTLLSVFFLAVTLVSAAAGAVRSRSRCDSPRYKAMTSLQKDSFDFLHKAINCVSLDLTG